MYIRYIWFLKTFFSEPEFIFCAQSEIDLLVISFCNELQLIHVHKLFIMHIGIWKHLTTLFWFRYETFIYLFEFKVFRHEERERETRFLTTLTFPSDPTMCGTPPQATGLALVSSGKSTSFLLHQISTLFFFLNSKIPSLQGMTSFMSPVPFFYLGFLLWHLLLSHPPRVCVNTCTQCVHLTKPCTKPKGKIYKTKNDNIKKGPSTII